MKFCIVGAGFSGAVLARHLSKAGHEVSLIDERPHLAGNCYTSRDRNTNIMVHHYGPHIFHTAHKKVWDYVQEFGRFRPYINRVKAVSRGRVYTLPVNLLTINQFFKTNMRPEEAESFIRSKADNSIVNPANFEEQALSLIGRELYEAFFKGYTRKQWGMNPVDLPASILKRLPVRFNYDDNYFSHPYQGIPENGYGDVIQNIISDSAIKLYLDTSFENYKIDNAFDHVFYTGPIDRFFNFSRGRLGYRTLDFKRFESKGDYQGTAVINYCDENVPYTRIAEHKHFTPWELPSLNKTVYFREYSRLAGEGDTPYYPIRLATQTKMLKDYISLANQTRNVSFLGRLGTYRYLDMDITILEALNVCRVVDERLEAGGVIPSFFVDMDVNDCI